MREIFWIDYFNTFKGEGYNLTKGGEGGNNKLSPFRDKVHTEKWKEMMSKKFKGKNNPFYGKNHSKESKEKISKSKKGFKHKDRTKQKLSEINKGKNHPMYGIKRSLKTKNKISKANKGTKRTDEEKEKISKSHRKLTKKQCLEIFNLYKNSNITQNQLANKFNVSRNPIHHIINLTYWSSEYIKKKVGD